jgi:hypothetical protein
MLQKLVFTQLSNEGGCGRAVLLRRRVMRGIRTVEKRQSGSSSLPFGISTERHQEMLLKFI